MTDLPDDRIYSVVEFLANQEQIGGGIAKVRGPLAGLSESSCRVGDPPEFYLFDAGDLPEADRISLLESAQAGKAARRGVVTIDCKAARAKEVKFED